MNALTLPGKPKFSPKPVKRPMKVLYAVSDSPYPLTPKAPVKK
jgi:hypothetical protein